MQSAIAEAPSVLGWTQADLAACARANRVDVAHLEAGLAERASAALRAALVVRAPSDPAAATALARLAA